MTNHNYGFDVNYLISKSNEQGLDMVESYTLQLDDFLSNLEVVTPEMENLMNKTVEFLYGLVSE